MVLYIFMKNMVHLICAGDKCRVVIFLFNLHLFPSLVCVLAMNAQATVLS